jgi:hypothetical protein
MSEFAKGSGTSSEDLADFIQEGVQKFCRLFQSSQFDKMAQFYTPGTTMDAAASSGYSRC